MNTCRTHLHSLVLAALALLPLVAGAAWTAPVAAKTLPAGTVPWGVALDSMAGVAFMASFGSGTASALEPEELGANHLAFTTQPGNSIAGSPITPAIQVAVQDDAGDTITTAATPITLRITEGSGSARAALSGTTTWNTEDGVATFDDLSIDVVTGAWYTLTASAAGMEDVVSSRFLIIPGDPVRLAFTAPPRDVAAGSPITPALRVVIQDAWWNTVAKAPATLVEMKLGPGSPPGVLSGTTRVTTVNGVAVFSNLKVNLASPLTYTLVASAAGLTDARSDAFRVVPGAPVRFFILQQPSDAVAGVAIAPPVRVALMDAQGNMVTNAANPVTAALASNPGSGTLGGTIERRPANGVVTFGDLWVDKAANGYRLSFASSGVVTGSSTGFNISPAAPAKLTVTQQPNVVMAGGSFTVKVEVQDTYGNKVPGATHPVWVALADPGRGNLHGPNPVAAAGGVATFTGMNIDKAGAHTLTFTADGLASGSGRPITIYPAAPAQLGFIAQPGNSAGGGAIPTGTPEKPAVQVAIQDAYGNTVPTARDTITLALGNNVGPGTLSGTLTVATSAGVASFSRLYIDKVGAGYTLAATSAAGHTGSESAPFDVLVGPAFALAFRQQPTTAVAGQAIAPAVAVAVVDAGGNTVPTATNTVSITLGNRPAPGTLRGTTPRNAADGIATFDDLWINKVGSGYTLRAAAADLRGAVSDAFDITPAAPASLAFLQQPTGTVAGEPMTPAVTAEIRDAFGNRVTSATTTLLVGLLRNPGKGILAGQTAVNAVAGLATFDDLSIDRAASGYALLVAAPGLPGAMSASFNVTAGAAARLAFVVQPRNTTAGAAFAPAVKIAVQDQAGNVLTGATAQISVDLFDNPGGATLAGTTSAGALNGAATFANLGLDRVGARYTLAATAPGLEGAVSARFDVAAAPAAKLAFTGQPGRTTAGAPFAPPVAVTLQDRFGNTVTAPKARVGLSLGINPTGAALSGATAVDTVNGVAVFPTLSVSRSGSGYALRASAAGVPACTSAGFEVAGAQASGLVFLTQPKDATAGAALTPAVRVAVQDGFGNILADPQRAITLAITAGTGKAGATLTGTVTANTVHGIATFADLTIDIATGLRYSLTAATSGLPSAVSAPFLVRTGTLTGLAFLQQPRGTTAGRAISPAVRVAVRDAGGNTVTTAAIYVTVSLDGGPGGSIHGTLTTRTVAGIATFSNLILDKAGAGYTLRVTAAGASAATSTPFDVVPGAPTRLVFSAQPQASTGGATLSPAVEVSVRDAYGNVVANANRSVALALGSNAAGGTLSGTRTRPAAGGIATFGDLSIDRVGAGYTLRATATGLTSATSVPFHVTVGPASRLSFKAQPRGARAGATLTPAITVAVQDAGGNTLSTATDRVVMGIDNNPSGGTLRGATAKNAVAGVATFSDLQVDLSGQGYTLFASSGRLVPATSAAFNITPAYRLVFRQQPSIASSGVVFDTPVVVAVVDDHGAPVTGKEIRVRLSLSGTGGTLLGTVEQAVNTTAGTATFSNLSIQRSGTAIIAVYTLNATAPGADRAVSGLIAVARQ